MATTRFVSLAYSSSNRVVTTTTTRTKAQAILPYSPLQAAQRSLLHNTSRSTPNSTNHRASTTTCLLSSSRTTTQHHHTSYLTKDSSMIAANNRCISSLAAVESKGRHDTAADPTLQRLPYMAGLRKDSSMIAANDRGLHASASKRAFSAAPQVVVEEPEDDEPEVEAAKPQEGGAMQDEYGEMNDDGHTYVHASPFALECGQVLPEAQLRYQTYGQLNDARDNVLVICHALTGNASLHAWWGDLLGPGKAFDTDKYFVVCCNILGSCYGSSNPTSINPTTGKPYGMDFPDVSVKDTVRLQLEMLVQELKVHSIQAVIGGSFGGMQAVEFAVQAGSSYDSPYADDCYFTTSNGDDSSDDDSASKLPLVRSVIPIACGAAHTAWQIAISETQRQAIYADPQWASEDPATATRGLSIARQIGMVSYRTPKGYCAKFGRDMQMQCEEKYGSKAPWKVKSYLSYQGEKFLSRFDPITYVKMTEQMDSHDVARGRGEQLEQVLQHVEIPALVMGIDSDVLYPLSEQEELASYLPNGTLKIIRSDDGHDGFLLEQDQVAQYIVDFLDQQDKSN